MVHPVLTSCPLFIGKKLSNQLLETDLYHQRQDTAFSKHVNSSAFLLLHILLFLFPTVKIVIIIQNLVPSQFHIVFPYQSSVTKRMMSEILLDVFRCRNLGSCVHLTNSSPIPLRVIYIRKRQPTKSTNGIPRILTLDIVESKLFNYSIE